MLPILNQEPSKKKLVFDSVLDCVLVTLIRSRGQAHRCVIYFNIVSEQEFAFK